MPDPKPGKKFDAPRSLRSRDQRGKRIQLDDPVKIEARKRIRAAKWCTTAFFAGLGAPVGVFLHLFLGLGFALTASVSGIVGLVSLSAVGMGREDGEEVAPIERVASRMARRAKPQAGTGIAVGILALIYQILLILNALD